MRQKFRALFLFVFSLPGAILYGNELQNDIDRATIIIREFKELPEKGIPAEILTKAKGLAILKVIKGAFFVSGRGGQGIVIAKHAKGWSAPAAIGVGGGWVWFSIWG